jgi:hypothetical protein
MAESLRGWYSEEVIDPEAWIRTARQLEEAANCLRPFVDSYWAQIRAASEKAREEMDQKGASSTVRPPVTLEHGELIPVHLMLMGMAAECLVKAALIRHGRVGPVSPGKFPKELDGHEILARVTELGIPINREEAILLWRLNEYSVWSARYPVTKKLEQFSPQMASSRDTEEAAALLEKLRAAAT